MIFFCIVDKLNITSMFKCYYGYIKFQRFFGVKAGRSVWNDAFIRTRYYRTEFEAREELRYLVGLGCARLMLRVNKQSEANH